MNTPSALPSQGSQPALPEPEVSEPIEATTVEPAGALPGGESESDTGPEAGAGTNDFQFVYDRNASDREVGTFGRQSATDDD